jgi:hypothetical protein
MCAWLNQCTLKNASLALLNATNHVILNILKILVKIFEQTLTWIKWKVNSETEPDGET